MISPVNPHELRINGSRDFFEFYVLNRPAVDFIVGSNVNAYAGKLNKDDLFQNIIMRFQRVHVLKRFRPEKSNLNTYLTNCVRGYIRTAHRRAAEQKKWHAWPTQKQHVSAGERTVLQHFSYVDAVKAGHRMFTEDDAEGEMYTKELVELFREKVMQAFPSGQGQSRNLYTRILELRVEGRKDVEIARMLGCSPTWVGLAARKIARICANLVSVGSNTCRNY
jgi:RNA polymerase sigma factor (sigma-70 family)